MTLRGPDPVERPIAERVDRLRAAGCDIPDPPLPLCEKLCSNCQTVAKRKPGTRWTCGKCRARLSRESNKQKNIEAFYSFACALSGYASGVIREGSWSWVYSAPHAPKEKLLENELLRAAALKRGEESFRDLVENHLERPASDVHFRFGGKHRLCELGSATALEVDWLVRDTRAADASGDTKKAIALAVRLGQIRYGMAVYTDLESLRELREKNAANARKKAAKNKPAAQQCENFVRTAYEDFQIETGSKDRAVFCENYLPTRIEKLRTENPALARRIENLKPSRIRAFLRSPRLGKKLPK